MVILALKEQGLDVYLPFGENTRCDLITDNGSRLSRVQCKTGRMRNGAVVFAACSSYAHHPNPKLQTRTYEGEIDEFGVFCPDTGAVYLIPIGDVPVKREATFRVSPARNGQRKGVRTAAAYEIARVEIY